MANSENSPDSSIQEDIFKIFPKLYSNDAKIRLSSASQLLEIISKDKEQSLDEVFFLVVERLIKGTTKPKDAPKIGSTILLTEILHSFSNFRISKLLEMSKKIIGDVNDELSVEGVTGWTLIFTSIVQSNRLDISDKKTLKELIRFMVQLGDKKPLCNIAICNIFEMLFDHQFDSEAFSSILKSSLKLSEHGDASPFHLYLILLIHKHPELSRVLDHIPTVDLDDPENLVKYVEATALYYPAIHPACIELFRHIDENDRMEVFWKPVFNNPLFSHDQSYKYHRVGLSFISAILLYLNEMNVNYIFSKQMMDLWMQSLATRVCRLHNTAIQLSKDLIENYDSYDAPLQASIISLLTESPGTVSFDEITQTKTVAQLYIKTKSQAVETLVNRIIEKIRGYKAASARDKMRSLFVGQLREIVKSAHIADSPEIKLTVLNFFLAHGYFDVSNDETLNLVTTATDSLIARIQSLFFKLISATCSSSPDVMEGVGLYALRLIKGGVPLKDDKTAPLWKKMKKMKIKFKKLKSTGDYEKQLSIFKPLLYANAISSFQDSNNIDTLIANFDELFECFKRSLGDSQEENEPKWPDVLLDLMISQFPAQSQFLSSIMIKAFRLIVSDVTLEGLEQLKIALLADKLEDEEEEEEEEEEDENDDQDGENAEKLEEDSDEEESDVSEDEEEDVDDEFKAKVTLALGPAAATGDETEAPIDDDEMFQLDEALSEAFRSKYSSDKHTQATLKILRSKCLDLVEIIFKSKEQSLDTIMFLIPVLVDAIKLYSSSKELELRARVAKLFMLLPNIKLFNSYDAVNAKMAQGLFKKGIDMASKMDNTYIQASAAKICVWIMSLSKHININTDWAFDHLLKLLQEYFSKPNSFVSKEFFMVIFQNHKIFNSQILEALSKSVFVNLRPFKKLGGLALITTYLRLCQNDIVEDKSIEACLQSIRKDAMTGLMSAINSQRSALINVYLCLIATISKFIPLNLNMQEVQVLESMHGLAKAGLTKPGKSARLKILSTVDEKVKEESRIAKKSQKDESKQNGIEVSATNDADVEDSDDEDKSGTKRKEKKSNESSPNKRKSDAMENKLTPKQKKRASLIELNESVERSKLENKKKTPEKKSNSAKKSDKKNLSLVEKKVEKDIEELKTSDKGDNHDSEEIDEDKVSHCSESTPSKLDSSKLTPIKSTPSKSTPSKFTSSPLKNIDQAEISEVGSQEIKEMNTSNTKESSTPDSSPEILDKNTSNTKGFGQSPKDRDQSDKNITINKSETEEEPEELEASENSPTKSDEKAEESIEEDGEDGEDGEDEEDEEDEEDKEDEPKPESPKEKNPVRSSPTKSPASIKGTPIKASPVKSSPIKSSPIKSSPIETTPGKSETPKTRKLDLQAVLDGDVSKNEKDKDEMKEEKENVEIEKSEDKEDKKKEEEEEETSDLQSPKKLNQSNSNLNSASMKSKKSLDTTPSSPKPSTSGLSSSKKSKSKIPTINDLASKQKINENIDENVNKLKSFQIGQEEEEPVVKKIKFEPQSENEDQEAPTPRVTRARVKTPRVIKQAIKSEPETKEEQLEADDELADFSIPRVQLIKTPSTRSRARSTTPTKEPTTPLRRSLRTRK